MGSNDLFDDDLSDEPLAARMRPRTINEFIGQNHIVGPGRLLRRAIQADQLTSVIFYGPPGTGKTTLARVIANTTESYFTSLNAVLSGVKDVRSAIAEAQEKRRLYGKKTILFVDEVHRWNKAQQDALLPWVENGTVVLIGATTQNPFFEVNSALVSRSRIFQLKALTHEDLMQVARAALEDFERGYGAYDIAIDADALEHLVAVAEGDARSLLGALELAVETTPDRFPPPPGERIRIDLSIAEESIQRKAVLYDKEGDYHFDTISAFIKSIRGSDPDAALYWMARMIAAGEDPHYIFRRMLISASEDVGLADPAALGYVEAAARAFDRVGLPEGQFHLTQAVLYLATAPKSNTTLGFFDALTAVQEEQSSEVPSHLRDANRDKEGFGHGEGYLYPHAYRDHWVAQAYLPGPLQGRVFYKPSKQGYEAAIRDEVERRREIQLTMMMEEPPTEVLTFSPPDNRREEWIRRAESDRSVGLSRIRTTLYSMIDLPRHALVLVAEDGPGFLLWEAVRRTPEGHAVGLIATSSDVDAIEHYASHLPEIERPEVTVGSLKEYESDYRFDAVIARNAITRASDKAGVLRGALTLSAPGARFALAQLVPSQAMRLSELIADSQSPIVSRIREAEERLYGEAGGPLLGWRAEDVPRFLLEAGFEDPVTTELELIERRLIRDGDLKRWLSATDGATYGGALRSVLTPDELDEASELLRRRLSDAAVDWRTTVVCASARAPD